MTGCSSRILSTWRFRIGISNRSVKEILIRMEDNSYAIDASCVLEIVTLVQLEPVDKQSDYIAGQMRYRGQILPVLDLFALLLGRTHQKKFSTRILIVQLETQTVGLIAES